MRMAINGKKKKKKQKKKKSTCGTTKHDNKPNRIQVHLIY